MLLHGGGALHFVQVPVAPVPDDDVRLHEDVVEGEGSLVDGLRTVADLLAGFRQLLFLRQSVERDVHSPGNSMCAKSPTSCPLFQSASSSGVGSPGVPADISGDTGICGTGAHAYRATCSDGPSCQAGHLSSIDRDEYEHSLGPIVFRNAREWTEFRSPLSPPETLPQKVS